MSRRVTFVFDVEANGVSKQINVRMNERDLELLDAIVEWLQETKALPGQTITRQDAIMYALHELDKRVRKYAADRDRPR